MIDDVLRAWPDDYSVNALIDPTHMNRPDISSAYGCPPGPPITDGPYLANGTPDGRAFLVIDGTKRWIAGPDVFNDRGFSWGAVRGVDAATLEAMPEGPNIA
jgi:hypothetical protein